MGEVKWVKMSIDMFDNRKIKYLRGLPEGNNIVLIWVMLLTLAGRCNSNGYIFLTENIPYTPAMLANELGFPESTILVAMKALESMGMISRNEENTLLMRETYSIGSRKAMRTASRKTDRRGAGSSYRIPISRLLCRKPQKTKTQQTQSAAFLQLRRILRTM